MSIDSFTSRLNQNPLRRKLVQHEFFRRVRAAPTTKEQAAIVVGQWWHPLHYFPTFLARCVSVLPDISAKCAISKILNQETGEGNPAKAHEVLYIDSMECAGFSRAQIAEAVPFAETEALVAGYNRAPATPWGALGFVFATEVADLAMVSGIGAAVEQATGTRDLQWVEIHVQQEPDHVQEANHALLRSFEPAQEALVMDRAEEMWRLWIAFFDRLEKEAFAIVVEPRQESVVANFVV